MCQTISIWLTVLSLLVIKIVLIMGQDYSNYETSAESLVHSSVPLIQRRYFNSSYATTISLFEFSMPRAAAQNVPETDLINQAVFGIFAMVFATVILALPAIFTPVRSPTLTARGGMNAGGGDESEHILSRLLKAEETTSNFWSHTKQFSNRVGLDGTKCIQRAVCQAHRRSGSDYYGLIAAPFLIFVRPLDDKERKIPSAEFMHPFKTAAWNGLKNEKSDCGETYKCFLDLLGLTKYFFTWYTSHQV